MEWISVKDRLPEKTGKYIVLRDNEIQLDVFFITTRKNHWYNYLGITHWMKLPDLPTT